MVKAKQETTPQTEKFVEMAKAIGCDDDELAFKERLRKLVATPAKKETTKPKKRSRHSPND